MGCKLIWSYIGIIYRHRVIKSNFCDVSGTLYLKDVEAVFFRQTRLRVKCPSGSGSGSDIWNTCHRIELFCLQLCCSRSRLFLTASVATSDPSKFFDSRGNRISWNFTGNRSVKHSSMTPPALSLVTFSPEAACMSETTTPPPHPAPPQPARGPARHSVCVPRAWPGTPGSWLRYVDWPTLGACLTTLDRQTYEHLSRPTQRLFLSRKHELVKVEFERFIGGSRLRMQRSGLEVFENRGRQCSHLKWEWNDLHIGRWVVSVFLTCLEFHVNWTEDQVYICICMYVYVCMTCVYVCSPM